MNRRDWGLLVAALCLGALVGLVRERHRWDDSSKPSKAEAAHVGQHELCAGLWVKVSSRGVPDEDDLRRVIDLPAARRRLIETLSAEPSEFARAGAIVLGGIGDGKARDALARAAVSGHDPQVYALAVNACGSAASKAGACRSLSLDRWAHLDPGNAAPWLFGLTDAVARGDVTLQTDMLGRIASSSRNEQNFFELAGLVIGRIPESAATVPVTRSLVNEMLRVRATWSAPIYDALLDACKPTALADPARRRDCDAVAELFVARADTLLDRAIGIALGKRLGWSAERIDQLRGEAEAYTQEIIAAPPDARAYQWCADQRHELDVVMRHQRLAHLGALPAWVASSNKRPQDFISIEREARESEAAPASSAASSTAEPVGASSASSPR